MQLWVGLARPLRRRALEAGADLRPVRGTGPAARVTHDDLDAHLRGDGRAAPAAAGRAENHAVEDVKVMGLRGGLARLFGLGFLLDVSNPKMPIFYLALLPGVLGTHPLTDADTLALLAVIVLVEALVIGAHVALALRARAALARPRRLQALNRGAGALMVGAGVLVASR